ncbi:hypothetical protein TNCT_504271 [Trichonephila clavata]|uniref:Uncharacterized protein n=1 Tax=Trichonephila clavata TaxID=2740835 RepID=A0A8X6LN83_TRICU|nr:hypothetical protein TNCT_504271 [Trichonephila clavata]
MAKCNAQSIPNDTTRIHIKSCMSIKTCEFDWEIEYISRLLPHQKLKGADFVVSNFTGYIGFRKSVKHPSTTDWGNYKKGYYVYLVIGNTTDKEMFLEYDVSILNGNNKKVDSCKSNEIFVITSNSEREVPIITTFLNTPNYFREIDGDKYIIKGVLKMHDDIHTVAYAQEKETSPICI